MTKQSSIQMAFQVIAKGCQKAATARKNWTSRQLLPKRLVIKMGQVFQSTLVAVATQSVMYSSLEVRLQDFGATQLSNLLRRFADGQVASARLAVLHLAARSESESLLCGLVSL
jgi:hypothetical protein